MLYVFSAGRKDALFELPRIVRDPFDRVQGRISDTVIPFLAFRNAPLKVLEFDIGRCLCFIREREKLQ